MNPIELLALSRLISDSQKPQIRNQIAPGDYHVNLDIHIEGDISVAEDYEKRPTVSVPWTEAYALLREVAFQGVDEMIARVDRGEKITRQDLEVIKTAGFLSEDIMVETMKRAFDAKKAPKGAGSIMDRVPEVEAAAEKVKELIAGRLGLTSSKGPVRAELSVSQIAAPQAAPQINPVQIAQAVPPGGINSVAPATP